MIIQRTKNAVNGTLTGVAVKILQLVLSFAVRTIFIRTLGIEYLGLNSLFASVFQVLNLAELGVSSALVFSMYKPIAEDDRQKICELMNLYRYYYRCIGAIVLCAGLVIIPVLPHLIEGTVPEDINLYLVYILNLIATVMSYWLFSYRSSILYAQQRLDIVNIITFFITAFTYAAQIICIVRFRNYYLYLTISIISQIVLNIIAAIVSKKMYPEFNPSGQLPIEERKQINSRVRDLFTARIGMVVNNSVDTMVISAFLGLQPVAVYQNYYYVVSSVMAFFNIFFAACTAGIGNSLIVNDDDSNRRLLYNLNHILFFAINFCCACLICLYQPFMKIWVGTDYMLDFRFVVLFAVYLFFEEAPRTMLNFKDAAGMWREDRLRPLITAAANVILNIILVQFIGLYGILLSTVLSFAVIAFPWLIHNIDKCLFKLNIPDYVMRYLKYAIVTIVSSTVCYFICESVVDQHFDGIVELFIRLMICTIVSIGIFFIIFAGKEETKYMIGVFSRMRNKDVKTN